VDCEQFKLLIYLLCGLFTLLIRQNIYGLLSRAMARSVRHEVRMSILGYALFRHPDLVTYVGCLWRHTY